MANKVRVFKLRAQKEEELQTGLVALKQELGQLRTTKVSGGAAPKIARIRLVRKRIAKYLTVINQQRRAQISKSLEKTPKKLPLDLRGKKTRAIRRRLTKNQKNQKTERQWKKDLNFPLRKFALKN